MSVKSKSLYDNGPIRVTYDTQVEPACYDEDISEEFIDQMRSLLVEENKPERKRLIIQGPAW